MESFPLINLVAILLIIALVIIFFKFPSEIIRGLFSFFKPNPHKPATYLFAPIWYTLRKISNTFKINLIEQTDEEKGDIKNLSEEPYPSKGTIRFDFDKGKKLIYSAQWPENIKDLIIDYTSISSEYLDPNEFKFTDNKKIISCPENICFYDFNILIQHINDSCREKVFGIYLSDHLSFYFYQDPNTLHNLIGKTFNNEVFSIYTLDDFNEGAYLSLGNLHNIEAIDVDIFNTLRKNEN
ncbi:MAG: hypothetical protein ACK40G_03055 [Cytophagaceae bacterium]